MKATKIKETIEIGKLEPKINCEKVEKPVCIERHLYTENSISKAIGSINNQIYSYQDIYHHKPTLILISKELEILLSRQANLMNQHQIVRIDEALVGFNLIFGFPCLVTPTLKDLEFEIR